MSVTLVLTASLVLALATASERHEPEEEDANDHRWDFVVVPSLSLNADEGIGGGAIFALYHHHAGVKPYRDDISLRLHLTSRLVQRHEVRWEGLEVLELPLRASLRLGFFSTLTQTYCGTGNAVTCDDNDAALVAQDLGLVAGSEESDDLVRRYHTMRFVQPYADVVMRWRLLGDAATDAATVASTVASAEPGALPGALRVELLGGWRGAAHFPGALDAAKGFDPGPWPHSLYAAHFPEGEAGFTSVLQAGVTVDTRDFEPWPSEGFFAEASVRAASPWWGSSARANYQGIDAAWSSYALLVEDHNLVLANRALVDLMWGDVPVDDLASTGGTRNHAAFGGQWIGRGIRDHRYVGKIKVIDQLELRSDIVTLHAFGARLDVGSALFVDAAWIGADWDDFGGDPWRVLFGVGAGVNVLLNRAIQLCIDIAASPYEQNVPALYTPVKFPF